MRLPARIDSYTYRFQPEFAPLNTLPPLESRAPTRLLLVIALVVTVAFGAVVYLRRMSGQPALDTPSRTLEKKEIPLMPELELDAAAHAAQAARLVTRAMQALGQAGTALERVRPYANSDVDHAADKVAAARRDLDAVRSDLRAVEAIVNKGGGNNAHHND